jgi:hypothetical protein
VLVLVRAVPGDLRRQVGLRAGHQRRDPAVLPPALTLAVGGDGAEQLERLVVIEDLLEDRPGREHPNYLRSVSHCYERRAKPGEVSSHEVDDLGTDGGDGDARQAAESGVGGG